MTVKAGVESVQSQFLGASSGLPCGTGAEGLEAALTAFPGASEGGWTGGGAAGDSPIWETSTVRRWRHMLCHSTGPSSSFLENYFFLFISAIPGSWNSAWVSLLGGRHPPA